MTENAREMPQYYGEKVIWALKVIEVIFDKDLARKEERPTDDTAILHFDEEEYAPRRVSHKFVKDNDLKDEPGYYVHEKGGRVYYVVGELSGYTLIDKNGDEGFGEYEGIMRVAHEANRAWCVRSGLLPIALPYEHVDYETKKSLFFGVKYALEGKESTPEEHHKVWMEFKQKNGWKLGPEKDAKKKTHPNMVTYDKLPEVEKKKDLLFRAIVMALK